MKKSVLLAIIMGLFFACEIMAQEVFERTYGGVGLDVGNSGQQTNDGGYVVCGSFGYDDWTSDVYLIKTNASGDTLWTRTYGGENSDFGKSVQQTSDGGYIIAGYTGAYPNYDVYLLKTDGAGDTLWTRTYGGTEEDCGNSVQQTLDGGYVITGYTGSLDSGFDVYLIKTDASGDTLWTRTYGGSNFDYGYFIQQTSDGGYVVCGSFAYDDWTSDVYLIKTNASGDTLWTRTYGGENSDYGKSLQQTSDGGYIIAGYIDAYPDFISVYLIKTDEIGDTIWTKTYGGTEEYYGNSVQQTTDGGYVIAGYSGAFTSGYDVYLIKTDASGDTLWSRTYGGSDYDYGYFIQQTSDGGYVVGGSFGYDDWTSDVYLIKTNENGMVTYTGWITGNISLNGGSGNLEDVEVTAGSVTVNPDISGDYTIEIDTGTYNVIATLDGYEPDTVTDVVVEEGITTSNIDLTLTYSTGVENNVTPAVELLGNYPNPFNSSTIISFSVTQASSPVNIEIYNLTGQKVKTLINKKIEAGSHQVVWDGTDDSGNPVSSEIYFCKMEFGKYTNFKKIILMK